MCLALFQWNNVFFRISNKLKWDNQLALVQICVLKFIVYSTWVLNEKLELILNNKMDKNIFQKLAVFFETFNNCF